MILVRGRVVHERAADHQQHHHEHQRHDESEAVFATKLVRRPSHARPHEREYDRTVAAVRERMTWDDLGVAATTLAERIQRDEFRPDLVLAVARGGLLAGGALAYALGVKNTFTMNVEFYTDVDTRLPAPMILPPVADLVELGRSTVLVVDDVADTGETLALVQSFCTGKVGAIRTAVLYEKPRSRVRCDYVWRRTKRWIDFPWSSGSGIGVDDAVPETAPVG